MDIPFEVWLDTRPTSSYTKILGMRDIFQHGVMHGVVIKKMSLDDEVTRMLLHFLALNDMSHIMLKMHGPCGLLHHPCPYHTTTPISPFRTPCLKTTLVQICYFQLQSSQKLFHACRRKCPADLQCSAGHFNPQPDILLSWWPANIESCQTKCPARSEPSTSAELCQTCPACPAYFARTAVVLIHVIFVGIKPEKQNQKTTILAKVMSEICVKLLITELEISQMG